MTSDRILLGETDGPVVHVLRLAEGATRFLREQGGTWKDMLPADVDLIEVGTAACVEALLDRSTLVAVKVFVGRPCGPRT